MKTFSVYLVHFRFSVLTEDRVAVQGSELDKRTMCLRSIVGLTYAIIMWLPSHYLLTLFSFMG